MKSNLLLFAFTVISSALIAQTTVWNPGAFDNSQGLWINPGNWTNGLPGTTAPKTVFNVDGAMDCIIDEDVTAEDLNLTSLPKIVQGDGGPGGVIHIVDGGAITTAAEWSGIGWTHPAKLIVDEGGEITFGEHMWIAFEDGSGGTEVQLDGGTINVTGMFGMDWQAKGNACTLFLNSGLLNLAQIHHEGNSMGENAMIEYVGGMIQISGDHKEILETLYVDKITGDYEIWVEETITETDTTYVTKLSNEAPTETSTVVDIITESENHTVLASALADAGLVETLQGDGPFTVFAPTDEAFAALPDGFLDGLSVEELTDVLLYHVVGSLALSTDLSDAQEIETLLTGESVIVSIADDVVTINNAEVTAPDLQADNGVVHVIDAVLVTDDDTSIGDIIFDDISIYPNPAASQLYVSHNVKIDRVEIYNLTGSIILRKNHITTGAIDISDLNSGLYFISVFDVDNNNIVRKFVKQ
jgi:uncharacterized surface protein with fasciclin (FAS1) repeats